MVLPKDSLPITMDDEFFLSLTFIKTSSLENTFIRDSILICSLKPFNIEILLFLIILFCY